MPALLAPALAALLASALAAVPASAQEEPQQDRAAEIAFQRNENIWISDADGTGARLLYEPTDANVVPYPVAWLPDGNLLVIESTADCTTTVSVARDGTARVFPHPEQEGCPQDVAISPEGRFAAFASYLPPFACREAKLPSCTNLSYRAIDRGQPRYVRAGTGEPLWFVRFAPDGVTLYAVRREVGGSLVKPGTLIAIDLIRGTSRTVAPEVDAIDVNADGDIAMQRDGSIVLRTTDGKERALGAGSNPAFAPDGAGVYAERDGQVWLLPFGEGDPLRITEGSVPTPSRTYHPTPRQAPAEPVAFLRDGHVWYAGAGGERKLTEEGGLTSFGWADDGRSLIAVRDGALLRIDATSGDERAIDTGGRKVTRVVTHPGTARMAVVAPDEDGVEQVWLGPIGQGTSQRVTELKAPAEGESRRVVPSFSADGTRLLVTLDDGKAGRLLGFDTGTRSRVDVPDVPAVGAVAMAADGTLTWTERVVGARASHLVLRRGEDVLLRSLDDSFDPTLGPDGERLMFTRATAGTAPADPSAPTVWQARADGSEAAPVAVGGAAPAWQPGTALPVASSFPASGLIVAGIALLLAGLAAALVVRGGRRREEAPAPAPAPAEPAYGDEDLLALCPECGAAMNADDEWCERCGLRRDDCGCVWYRGTRRITCWPHFKERQEEQPVAEESAAP